MYFEEIHGLESEISSKKGRNLIGDPFPPPSSQREVVGRWKKLLWVSQCITERQQPSHCREAVLHNLAFLIPRNLAIKTELCSIS